jgi:hypothetical protein
MKKRPLSKKLGGDPFPHYLSVKEIVFDITCNSDVIYRFRECTFWRVDIPESIQNVEQTAFLCA